MQTRERYVLLFFRQEDFQSYPLPNAGTVTIGRATDADIRIEDPSISRLHAALHIGPGLEIEDLGSENGTRLLAWSGRAGPTGGSTARANMADRTVAPKRRVPVSPGHVIQLGSTTLVVQHAAAAPQATRFMSHGYLEARLGEECARAERSGSGVALIRVQVDPGSPSDVVEAALVDATGPDQLLAAYAPGAYDVLLLGADRGRTTELLRRIGAASKDKKIEPRIAMARFPEDGRSAHALLAAVSARIEGREEKPAGSVVACDPAMLRLFALAERVAAGTIPVLLIGETGAGKEILAETIHRCSPRARRSFLRLNCGALSETLLESELFGHERGAFTGANRAKAGLLETAKGGTVFLDEIGELPLSLQVKLLRVLEEHVVLPVGGLRPRPIDVRFVSATNRDLAEDVRLGRFREDLYFRINGAALIIPPLRERRSEIEPLVRHFLGDMARRAGRSSQPQISAEALDWLRGYSWPGNVRELRNVIERALLLCGPGPITLDHLPTDVAHTSLRAPPPPDPASMWPEPAMSRPDIETPFAPPSTQRAGSGAAVTAPPGRPVAPADVMAMYKDVEREHTLRALEECGGNQTRAAKLLGISRRTLLNRLDAYRVARPRKGAS